MPTEPVKGGSRRWHLVRAGKDAVPDSLRRLMSRARPSQLAAVPWTLIAASLTVVALAGWIIFVSPLFGIKQVEVSGVGLLSEEEVLQAAGVPLGQPLTRVDTDSVVDRVTKLPAAESVEVTRGWPSTLRIKVIERVGVAVVKQDTVFQVFDRFGVQFISAPAPPADTVEVALPQNMPADRAMRDALRVIASLTAELRTQLIRLVVNGPAGIQLLLQKDRMVTWGDAEESELKAKVATALLTQKGKRIDVSVPEIVTIQ
jgi:cell division protein FtsQ